MPSILMVAPTGITKEATFLLIPRLLVAVFKVTGIVAALDEVLNAKSIASFICLKNWIGDTFAKVFNISE